MGFSQKLETSRLTNNLKNSNNSPNKNMLSESKKNILARSGLSKRTDRTESETFSYSGYQVQQQ